MENVSAIVLAAGQGKRMQATKPKVAHTALGKPLLAWSLDCLRNLGIKRIQVVVSPAQTEVQKLLSEYKLKNSSLEIATTYQEVAKGTGHATKLGFTDLSKDLFNRGVQASADILVVTGDTPLLSTATLRSFVSTHQSSNFQASLIAFVAANPFGYGRVLCDKNGDFMAIREEKDCSTFEKQETLCNSGVLCAQFLTMASLLEQIAPNKFTEEYYLTDLPSLVGADGGRVGVFRAADSEEFEGVNTQHQLAAASKVLLRRVLNQRLAEGVHFESLETVYVEESVRFGKDVIVEPFVSLRGEITIPDGTRIVSGTGLKL